MTDLIDILQKIQHADKTHVDLYKRRGSGSLQWFLEKDAKTRPIHNNNDLQFFMCGQEGFAAIEADIRAATTSIDIVLWGFDPGMELVRKGTTWPRGQTYGDLLTAKAEQGVKVRLLLWYEGNTKNNHIVANNTPDIGWLSGLPLPAMPSGLKAPDTRDKSLAQVQTLRAQYCRDWWTVALRDGFKNLEIRLRRIDPLAMYVNLAQHLPDAVPTLTEEVGMGLVPTHHQKPVLIDYAPAAGAKAKANTCGYVMGLNSVTDYWDTSNHGYNDPLRELSSEGAFWTKPWHMKPYRDYAIRVAGEALYSLNENFVQGWDTAEGYGLVHGAHLWDRSLGKQRASIRPKDIPRPSGAACRAQIVRTFPADTEATILKAYALATSNALNYLYVENQYFQLTEWSKFLKKMRQQYREGMIAAGAKVSQLTPLHVFVVIPQAERSEMVPSTYDTLNQLGQGQGMATYDKQVQAQRKARDTGENPGSEAGGRVARASVEAAPANPVGELNALGIKALAAMLLSYGGADKAKDILIKKRDNNAQTLQAEQQEKKNAKAIPEVNKGKANDVDSSNYSEFNIKPGNYREIYIHSKLMLIDDVYTTLGSANLNARSMAGDSELNICTEQPSFTQAARRRVWGNLAGSDLDGKNCTPGEKGETAQTFNDWVERMNANKDARRAGSEPVKGSFIHPFEDPRGAPPFRLA
jgi:phosphatidylserine/phosphatidylglycerophosphate/cardiolipin synthase-like enzyme